MGEINAFIEGLTGGIDVNEKIEYISEDLGVAEFRRDLQRDIKRDASKLGDEMNNFARNWAENIDDLYDMQTGEGLYLSDFGYYND